MLSILGMGGLVLGILAWQEGAEAVLLLLAIGVVGLAALAWWLVRQKRTGKTALIDPDLFRSLLFRYGITGQHAPAGRPRRDDDRAADLPADGLRLQRAARPASRSRRCP